MATTNLNMNNKQINNLADAIDENDAVNLNMLSRFTAELKFKLDDKTEMLQEKCDRLERYLNNLKKHYQRKMLAKMGNYKIVTIKIKGINKIPQKIIERPNYGCPIIYEVWLEDKPNHWINLYLHDKRFFQLIRYERNIYFITSVNFEKEKTLQITFLSQFY